MAEKKFGSAGAKVVMEEFLEGEEVSFLVFSDGSRVVPMASVQDHKRALDGDQGPNTGGMGTVSPTTNISLDGHKRIMQEIVLPTIAGLAAEGRRFQGVLFAGLMMTEAGPKVLEFNARFGDPETQVIMARMRSDIVPILEQCATGAARRDAHRVGEGAGGLRRGGEPGLPRHAGDRQGRSPASTRSRSGATSSSTTRPRSARTAQVKTVGGRVLGVTALGANLESAIARAYEAIGRIQFDGMTYRRDIGARALARLHGAAPGAERAARPAARPARRRRRRRLSDDPPAGATWKRRTSVAAPGFWPGPRLERQAVEVHDARQQQQLDDAPGPQEVAGVDLQRAQARRRS